MKVVVLANMRFLCYCPSLFRLHWGDATVDLIFNGEGWFLTNGVITVPVRDRDTGARLLAEQLGAQATGRGA